MRVLDVINEITRRMSGYNCAPALAGCACELLTGAPAASGTIGPWTVTLGGSGCSGTAAAVGAPTDLQFRLISAPGGRLRSVVPEPPAEGWRAWAAAWRAAMGLSVLTRADDAYERMSYADRAGRMDHRPELIPPQP